MPAPTGITHAPCRAAPASASSAAAPDSPAPSGCRAIPRPLLRPCGQPSFQGGLPPRPLSSNRCRGARPPPQAIGRSAHHDGLVQLHGHACEASTGPRDSLPDKSWWRAVGRSGPRPAQGADVRGDVPECFPLTRPTRAAPGPAGDTPHASTANIGQIPALPSGDPLRALYRIGWLRDAEIVGPSPEITGRTVPHESANGGDYSRQTRVQGGSWPPWTHFASLNLRQLL